MKIANKKESSQDIPQKNDDVVRSYFSIVKQSSLFKEFYNDYNKIEEVPLLDKATLREILEKKFRIQEEIKGVYLVRSGGSMRAPLIFPVDIEENLYQRRLLAKQLVNYRIFTSQTIALNIFSYQDMYRTAAIMDDILDRCNATTLALGCNSAYEDMYHTAKNFSPTVLMGTPSKINLLAKYIQQNNLELEIDNLLFAGEFLLPSQMEIFKNTFKTKCIYSLYGSAETGIWGWTNFSEKGSSFHILDEIIVEIVDPDKEGYGTILVTNLIRKRFPLFRYAMGDIGKIEYVNNKRILNLKSRESSSFLLFADMYFLSDFDFIKDFADRFQIQLSLVSAQQTIITFFIIPLKAKAVEAEQSLDTIRAKIEEVLHNNPKFVSVEVQIATELDLYVNPTTSKTPSIVDFRN